MDIEILGHNMRVNAALEDYTRKKLERLDRYLPNISDIRVELTHENTRRGEDVATAQITIRHQRGAILRTQESMQGDIELAINQAVDKMHRQIERFKGKRSRKGREKFSATVDELNIAEAIPGVTASDGAGEESEEISILRRKTVAVIAMDEEEAVEQMELLGHSFFVFYNERTGGMNIVYKRNAGGYGVLVPELT